VRAESGRVRHRVRLGRSITQARDGCLPAGLYRKLTVLVHALSLQLTGYMACNATKKSVSKPVALVRVYAYSRLKTVELDKSHEKD
jgi:hypothetical protein